LPGRVAEPRRIEQHGEQVVAQAAVTRMRRRDGAAAAEHAGEQLGDEAEREPLWPPKGRSAPGGSANSDLASRVGSPAPSISRPGGTGSPLAAMSLTLLAAMPLVA